MSRKRYAVWICLIGMVGIFACYYAFGTEGFRREVMGKIQKECIVIDPGHGGTDSGKIGVNQCLEKDINLEIAKKLKKQLEKQHVDVILTREKDEGLGDAEPSNHKREDMKKRVKIIDDSCAIFAVSIHQNSYPAEEVKGAQVFYYEQSENGKKIAEIMQEQFRLSNPENKREAKGNQEYYVLRKTKTPTIIVECGFLSNWEEAEKLATEAYQEKVANIICDGIMNILQQEI